MRGCFDRPRGGHGLRLRQPEPLRLPEAPAAELVPLLRRARGRVMETVHYRVQRRSGGVPRRDGRGARRCAAVPVRMFWQLYEDVAHPEGWMEVWSMESWTDHLREVTRLSDDDRAALARAGVFQCGGDGPRPARYIAVDPLH